MVSSIFRRNIIVFKHYFFLCLFRQNTTSITFLFTSKLLDIFLIDIVITFVKNSILIILRIPEMPDQKYHLSLHPFFEFLLHTLF